MAFDSTFISELKFRCSIDEVISRHISLKRNGSRYVACCPFHNEKTPSFTVFADTSSYYCFGCGAAGDIITFTMQYENLDYVEAVKALAERAGMQIPEDKHYSSESRDRRARMLEMHKLAAKHFHKNLREPGNPCIEYVKKRGLDGSSVTRFGLGYAKDSFDDLKNLLLKQGYSLAEMFAAGLVAKSQKNGSYYDKFRDRLMFPVFDLRGNVVAFSGRALSPDAKAKYMNSADTEIYKKGDIVFGLSLAKDKNDGTLILCEGNIDVVMLAQAGFTNAVAPLGTAFTVDQARVIAKYAKTVVVAFDGDSAGQKATEKAINFLKSQGVTVRVLQLSGAKDPDEYIKKFGKERFANLVNRSKTPTEYKMDRLLEQYDLDDTAARVEFISKVSDVISALDSSVEREIYASKLAKIVDVSVEVLKNDIERRHKRLVSSERKKQITEETRPVAATRDTVNPQRAANLLAARSEEMLIVLLAKNPELLDFIKERIAPSDFITDFNRQVFEFYIDGLSQDATVQTLSLSEQFDSSQVSRITFMLNTTVLSGDPRVQAEDCIGTIKAQHTKKVNTGDMTPEQLAELIKKEKK